MDIKKVLTIAGSDCSGGAGIQADLKTIAAHKLYGMSAITSLTAQNTTGVYGISDVTPEFLEKQLDCIFNDIVPDAVKIGMVSNKELIEVIARKLQQYHAKNIVLDPVMVSTSGSDLLQREAVKALTEKLMPIADIITPNIPEAEVLSGSSIHEKKEVLEAVKVISDKLNDANQHFGDDAFISSKKRAILLKGGHHCNTADDMLYYNGKYIWFRGEKIKNPNTHGTGCTLSSAIACNLAMGYTMEQAVGAAKQYVSGAIRAGLNIGTGKGPLNHMYNVNVVREHG